MKGLPLARLSLMVPHADGLVLAQTTPPDVGELPCLCG